MKLMAASAAYFPSEAGFRLKCWIFLRSCLKFGIPEDALKLYGCNTPQYTNLIEMRIRGTLRLLQAECNNFTHVLYTDCWDAFFTSGLDEITAKYQAMGSPPLVARIDNLEGYLKPAEAAGYPIDKGRGPTGGSFIAEIPYMIDALSRMPETVSSEDLPQWIEGWRLGLFKPTPDWNKDIFHNAPAHWECEIRDGRIINVESGTYPSMFHFGGAYCDQDTGKDYMLRPWAEKIGIIGKDEPRSACGGYPECWR